MPPRSTVVTEAMSCRHSLSSRLRTELQSVFGVSVGTSDKPDLTTIVIGYCFVAQRLDRSCASPGSVVSEDGLTFRAAASGEDDQSLYLGVLGQHSIGEMACFSTGAGLHPSAASSSICWSLQINELTGALFSFGVARAKPHVCELIRSNKLPRPLPTTDVASLLARNMNEPFKHPRATPNQSLDHASDDSAAAKSDARTDDAKDECCWVYTPLARTKCVGFATRKPVFYGPQRVNPALDLAAHLASSGGGDEKTDPNKHWRWFVHADPDARTITFYESGSSLGVAFTAKDFPNDLIFTDLVPFGTISGEDFELTFDFDVIPPTPTPRIVKPVYTGPGRPPPDPSGPDERPIRKKFGAADSAAIGSGGAVISIKSGVSSLPGTRSSDHSKKPAASNSSDLLPMPKAKPVGKHAKPAVVPKPAPLERTPSNGSSGSAAAVGSGSGGSGGSGGGEEKRVEEIRLARQTKKAHKQQLKQTAKNQSQQKSINKSSLLMKQKAHTLVQLFPRLWIGSLVATNDEPQLRRCGITHVLTCCAERVPKQYPAIIYRHHGFADDCDVDLFCNPGELPAGVSGVSAAAADKPTPPPVSRGNGLKSGGGTGGGNGKRGLSPIAKNQLNRDLQPLLPRAIDWVEAAWKSTPDAQVLVHCIAGVSRSASVCIGLIMKNTRQPLTAVLPHVRSLRPAINPNAGFTRQLMSYSKRLTTDRLKSGYGIGAAAARGDSKVADSSVIALIAPPQQDSMIASAAAASASVTTAAAADSTTGTAAADASTSTDVKTAPAAAAEAESAKTNIKQLSKKKPHK